MLYSTLVKAVLRKLHGEPPASAVEEEGVGFVVVADGVGGLNLLGMSLQYAMAREGLAHALKVIEWGHGFGRWHKDLTDVENHRAQARAMIAEVESFRAQRPEAPVFLVGKSGGCGIVVRALEGLPEEVVEATVLVAPALSPDYNLTDALRAVRREMVVFWSPLDVIVLGLGTRIFGTVDRVKAVGAGMVGFRVPRSTQDQEQRRQYAKLRQVRWHPRMASTGYLGGHVGPDLPGFLRKFVVPLLAVGAPGEESEPGSSQALPAPIT
jgi:pimeloyl-ACP methyl ester carboxylesterase